MINMIGREVWACTQRLTYSVRFQAPYLLYTTLFHRYGYCYLRYMYILENCIIIA